MTPEQQPRMARALADSIGARLIETHISYLLLAGGLAFKLKKAVATDFLDHRSLAARQFACAEELRLNRRLAPDLYEAAVPVTGSVDAPRLGGDGPPIDAAVRMQAFDEEGLWDRLAARGALGTAQIDELAAVVAGFHERAAVAPPGGPWGTPEAVRSPMLDNLRVIPALRPDFAPAIARLAQWEAAAFDRLAPRIEERLAQGRVREGHGDLHLGNVTTWRGRCTVFDGIEFSAALRWLDVASEIAFMAMDLQAHDLPALAHRFVDAVLARTGDYAAAPLLGYYGPYRALVRAKVALIHAAQPGLAGTALGRREGDAAAHYLALAGRLSQPPGAALVVMHGFSGSGKTTQSQALLEAAGALRIRADVERKRLAGLPPEARSASGLAEGLYGETMTRATYDTLLRHAGAVLDGNLPAVLDATFLRREHRDAARQLARERGVPFAIVDCRADVDTLHRRLRERAGDAGEASEADERVLELQRHAADPLADDERPAVFAAPAQPAGYAPLLARLGIG